MLSNKTVLMSQKHGHNSSERAKRDEQNRQTIIIKRKIKTHFETTIVALEAAYYKSDRAKFAAKELR